MLPSSLIIGNKILFEHSVTFFSECIFRSSSSAFFIFEREVWTKHHQRIGNNPYMAIVDKIEGIDIDWPEDFNFAEIVQKNLL